MDTDERPDDRPQPGPGDEQYAKAKQDAQPESGPDGANGGQQTGSAPQEGTESNGDGDGAKMKLDRSDESQDFVDQDKIDFDPDDGVYSGTAVDGTSEIPDMKDIEPDESALERGESIATAGKKSSEEESEEDKDERTATGGEQAYN